MSTVFHGSVQFYEDMALEKATKEQLSQNEFIAYVLGNFESVEEALSSLDSIDMGLTKIPGIAMAPPLALHSE